MKYFILFSLLTACTAKVEVMDISKDLEEINSRLHQNNIRLECLIKLQETNLDPLIDKHCIKQLPCVRKFIDTWMEKCIKDKQ